MEWLLLKDWAEVSTMKATDLAQEFANAGVEAIICTDISKDGMLCVELMLNLRKILQFQAVFTQ